MKTIYTTHVNDPIRLEISDEQVDSIQEARNRVLGLAVENPNWRPSLEIDLPTDFGLNCHAEGFIGRVRWDSGSADNIHNRVLKALAGVKPRGWVKVDLGHYCYEGWESAINSRDFSELPNVWFERHFIFGFSDPQLLGHVDGYDKLKNIVLPEHQRLLIPKVYRDANIQIRRTRISNMPNDELDKIRIETCSKIVNLCKEIYRGSRNFNDLVDLCDSVKDLPYQTEIDKNQGLSGVERQ